MVLELDAPSDLLQYLLSQGGTMNAHGVLQLPLAMGNGFLRMIQPYPGISILMQQFELNEELTIKRLDSKEENQVVIFSFRNVGTKNRPHGFQLPSVQVSTSNMALDIHVPAKQHIHNLIIGIELLALRKIL